MKRRIDLFIITFFILIFTPVLFAQMVAPDTNWPKSLSANGNNVLVYQPQIDEWKDGVTLTGKLAIQLIPSGVTTPMTGVLWFSADTAVNKENRSVLISHLNVKKITFYEEDPTKEEQAENLVKSMLPTQPVTISLDRLLVQMEKIKKVTNEIPLDNNPPKIYVSKAPAILVLFDGNPLWKEINNDLTFAVNTNWNIFFQPSSKRYFLLNDGRWLTSPDLKTWRDAEALPDSFNQLPNDDNWKTVKEALPLKTAEVSAPQVYVSTEPAEMIIIDGEPKLRAIPGTQLSAVDNTQSDLFYYAPDKNYYYLVTGRWFKSESLDGPWTYTSTQLPADFAKIPDSDPKTQVLASVPGTQEAGDAVNEAQIPTLATVNKNEVTFDVQYAGGNPQFKNIPGTSLQFAINTQTTVIKVSDNAYYALSNGIWFVANSPTGPWVVADKVPNEIYQIPPSSPVFNATFVKIYGNPDANNVIEGYTSGYTGTIISGGTVVWGTGYYYPPYVVMTAPYQPVYYPYMPTYGMNTYYSPYYGVYYRNGYAYGPYGGIGSTSIYNPTTGGYYHGAYAYGPYQAGRAFVAYNPATGVHAAGYQRWTPYASWGKGVVSKDGEWAKGSYYRGPAVSAAHGSTSGGQSGSIAKVKGGDLYVGKDGNVYRKDDSGNWQTWENGQWENLLKGTSGSTLQNPQESRKQNLQNKQNPLQENNIGKNLKNQPGNRLQNNQNSLLQNQQTPMGKHNLKSLNSDNMQYLNQENSMRNRGNNKTQDFQRWQSQGSNPRMQKPSSNLNASKQFQHKPATSGRNSGGRPHRNQ